MTDAETVSTPGKLVVIEIWDVHGMNLERYVVRANGTKLYLPVIPAAVALDLGLLEDLFSG